MRLIDAAEAISWVACREFMTNDALLARSRERFERLGVAPYESVGQVGNIVFGLRTVGNGQDLPVHKAPAWAHDPDGEEYYTDPVFSPDGPALLREIKDTASRISRSVMSYLELAERLATARRDEIADQRALQAAQDELVRAVAESRINAFGFRAIGPAKSDDAAYQERIDARFGFFDGTGQPILTIDRESWLSKDPRAWGSWPAWEAGKEPWHDRVTFDRDAVLALWPAVAPEPQVVSDASSAPKRKSVGGRPRKFEKIVPEIMKWLRTYGMPPDGERAELRSFIKGLLGDHIYEEVRQDTAFKDTIKQCIQERRGEIEAGHL